MKTVAGNFEPIEKLGLDFLLEPFREPLGDLDLLLELLLEPFLEPDFDLDFDLLPSLLLPLPLGDFDFDLPIDFDLDLLLPDLLLPLGEIEIFDLPFLFLETDTDCDLPFGEDFDVVFFPNKLNALCYPS